MIAGDEEETVEEVRVSGPDTVWGGGEDAASTHFFKRILKI